MTKQQEKNLERVKVDGANLGKIKNQTREMISEALSQDVMNLRFIKELTDEIALEAVSKKGRALQYIENQTSDIVLAAVSQNGYALRHVKKPTLKIALAAVTQNGLAIQYLKPNGFSEKQIKMLDVIVFEAHKNVGNDLLNYAISGGWTWIIKPLLSKDIDVNHTSELYELSPFQMACRECCHVDVMHMLKNKGANIHIKRSESQRNVLADTVANIKNHPNTKLIPVVIALLDMGIDPNEKDVKGINAIMLAENKPEILSVFKAYNLKKLVQETIAASQVTISKKRQPL
jgi:hypothetical protein